MREVTIEPRKVLEGKEREERKREEEIVDREIDGLD